MYSYVSRGIYCDLSLACTKYFMIFCIFYVVFIYSLMQMKYKLLEEKEKEKIQRM